MENVIELVRKHVAAQNNGRSAWARGVKVYAAELVDDLEEAISGGWFDVGSLGDCKTVEKCILNGADNWKQYSWGGSALIYDGDIAERLCNASELKKTQNGAKRPNHSEEWLDVQARALFQAAHMVKNAARYAAGK